MRYLIKRRLLLIALGIAAIRTAAAPDAARAADWPDRATHLVVPFAPGGTADLLARLIADRLARRLGKPVVVGNRDGAGGALGAEAVARAAPDGYTIGIATQSTHAAGPALNPRLSYDPLRDFAPIAMLALVPGVLTVHPSLPVQTMSELIALARKRPGRLSYGTPGVGSLGHLLLAQFELQHGVELLHVPYRGGGAMLADAIGGHVLVVGVNLPAAQPHLVTGRLRALGVMAERRVASLPDVPTFAELGMGEIGKPAWFGLVAPAGTPAPVIERLNAAVRAVMQEREVVAALALSGSVPAAGTPDDFARAIGETLQAFRAAVAARGIKPE